MHNNINNHVNFGLNDGQINIPKIDVELEFKK
jgi:hypothetical protein